MIKIVQSNLGGLNIYFDLDGIDSLIEVFQNCLSRNGISSQIDAIYSKNKIDQKVVLSISISPSPSIEISSSIVKLEIEEEDVEDGLLRFMKAKEMKNFTPMEWLQLDRAKGNRAYYLHVFFIDSVN
jgi:hypothetical protein